MPIAVVNRDIFLLQELKSLTAEVVEALKKFLTSVPERLDPASALSKRSRRTGRRMSPATTTRRNGQKPISKRGCPPSEGSSERW